MQHSPRSGNLKLLVRVGRNVRPHNVRHCVDVFDAMEYPNSALIEMQADSGEEGGNHATTSTPLLASWAKRRTLDQFTVASPFVAQKILVLVYLLPETT